MPTFQDRRFGKSRFSERRSEAPRRSGFSGRGFSRDRGQGFRGSPAPRQPGFQPAQGYEEHHETPGPHITRVVVPGEMLAASPKQMQFAFTDAGKTYSSILGLYDETDSRLVPLEGCYLPSIGDYVVGVVKDVKFSGYNLDIKSPYVGFLSNKETREEFDLGDILVAKVQTVDEVKNVHLSDASKLDGGEIIEVLSVKIPRIIGKKSSMISMIQNAAKSEIVVGKNGRVWIKGGDTSLAATAILKIEREAHLRGLTDRISALLGVDLRAGQRAQAEQPQQGVPQAGGAGEPAQAQ